MIFSLNASSSIADWFHTVIQFWARRRGEGARAFQPFSCVCECVCMEMWWLFLFFFCSLFPFFYVIMSFRSNPINADVLYLSDKKRLDSSHFNKSNALIVYLHGFSERVPGGAGQSSQEIRDGNERTKRKKKNGTKNKQTKISLQY